MNASIYYTLTRHPAGCPAAYCSQDRARLQALLTHLQQDGHLLKGIYITDPEGPGSHMQRKLLYIDAKAGRFDWLYLYLYETPLAISAKKLLDILDLPVDGGTPMGR